MHARARDARVCTRAQVVKMVSHGGGSNNINAVKEHLEALKGAGFTPDQVVKMVSCAGGSHDLVLAWCWRGAGVVLTRC